MKLIAVVLVSLSLALVVRGSGLRGYHVETFRHSADGQHLLLRTKREAGAAAVVCKYKKGDWSQCDSLLMVNINHQLSPGEKRKLVLTLVVNPVLVWIVCDLFAVMNYLSFLMEKFHYHSHRVPLCCAGSAW